MTAPEFPMPLPPTDNVGNSVHATDEKGAFEISGLIPGVEYGLRVQSDAMFGLGVITDGLKLASGEEKDLGEIVVK